MRIITRGKLPEEDKYRFACTYCGTVAEAERGEGNIAYDQRDGNAIAFTCPLCHGTVWCSLRGRNS